MIRYCIPHYSTYIGPDNFTFEAAEFIPSPEPLGVLVELRPGEVIKESVYQRFNLTFSNGEASHTVTYDLPTDAKTRSEAQMLRAYLSNMFFYLTYYSENPLFAFPTFYSDSGYLKELNIRKIDEDANFMALKNKKAINLLTAKYEEDAQRLAALFGAENFYGTYEIYRKNRRQRIYSPEIRSITHHLKSFHDF